MTGREKYTAIIVAGGKGTRMGTAVSKQFLHLHEKPILAHTIEAFQRSKWIADIVVVVPEAHMEFVQSEIVRKYALTKVKSIVAGGAERYDSVYHGLLACEDADIVLIHDGVRPFITDDLLARGLEMCKEKGNAICGVPSKDTVKITDQNGVVSQTPPRDLVWSVQTPQIFQYTQIRNIYDSVIQGDMRGVTDDAMLMETYGDTEVHMFMGDYRNIKITTPEDLEIAEVFSKNRN